LLFLPIWAWIAALVANPVWALPKPAPVTDEHHHTIADPSTRVAEFRRSPTAYRASSLGPPRQVQWLALPPETFASPVSGLNTKLFLTQQQTTPNPSEVYPERRVPTFKEQPAIAPASPSSPPDQADPNPDPNLTIPQPRCPEDPELGLPCIPTEPLPPPTLPVPRQPLLYLLPRLDYFRSNNIFAAVNEVDDGLVRPGITLLTFPRIGTNTYLSAAVDGSLVRYSNQTEFNYNELQFRAGVFQVLSPRMFGEIGWTNQQLFIASDDLPGIAEGSRFFNDHALRFELSRRDPLNSRLELNTFYQFRLSFAEPSDRSRISNTLSAALSYNILPNLQAGLSYQFALTDFTRRDREDIYHQLIGRLTHTMFRNTQFTLFAGYSFGSSTEPGVDFDSLILGITLSVNLGLF
jgi:hypothetical protein